MNTHVIWSPGVTLDAVERQVIQLAYGHFRGNKTATATALGISIRTLDHKLERYAAEADAEKEFYESDRRARAAQLARSRGIVGADEGGGGGYSPPVPSPRAETRNSASPGVRVEPAPDAPAQPAVSVPERREVQEVLQPKASAGGSRGRR